MGGYAVISQINKNTDCFGETGQVDISTLVDQLGSSNGFLRMQARDSLICIGKPAVPALVDALSINDTQFRWQVLKALEGILDPSAIPAFVDSLKDHNAGIRWTAANALINYQRLSIPALLEALVHDSDSIWLRQSAHHILHVMKDTGLLNNAEEDVFNALEDVEPAIAVPWAAEKALEYTRHIKNIASR